MLVFRQIHINIKNKMVKTSDKKVKKDKKSKRQPKSDEEDEDEVEKNIESAQEEIPA